jgi:hemolysin activation/secretion protein
MVVRRLSVGLALCVSISAAANAQIVPGPANPGRIEQRFQPAPKPQSAPEITIPGPQAVLPPDRAAQIHFQLKSVVIDGATVFQATAFAHLYAPLLGREISLLDAYKLRDAITAKYRAAGYILSQAIIPPQNVADGMVHIQVVEGYIANVIIEGKPRDPRHLIKAMAERIKRYRPLRERDLERYILLISDLPGVTVNTVLKPSPDQPGAADLVVIVTQRLLSGSADADNRGSRAIGPEEFSAGVNLNSALGLDEQTSILLATTARTRELHYISLHHEEILNPEGWRLDLSGSYSDSKPGGALSALDSQGKGTILSALLTDPILRSRSQSLKLGLGFTLMNTTTDLLGARFADDRVRFATLNATYDFADTVFGAPASNLAQGEIDHGFSGLGASKDGSPDLSRANGRSDFTLISGQATRVQSLIPRVSVAFAIAGQYAFDPLLSSQQFGLGSRRFGRGYEPSELTGDSGAALSIEPRYDPPLNLLVRQPELYAFYEVGEVWQKSPLVGQPKDASLASAGLGFRFQLGSQLFADFELAKPLTRDIASRGNKDIRPIFDISTTF